MSAAGDIRPVLRTYSWARAQCWLRAEGLPVTFTTVCLLIEAETGLELAKVRAALGGGFSSAETQVRLARWNGLTIATKHGAPVLICSAGGADSAADSQSLTDVRPSACPARAQPERLAGGRPSAAVAAGVDNQPIGPVPLAPGEVLRRAGLAMARGQERMAQMRGVA